MRSSTTASEPETRAVAARLAEDLFPRSHVFLQLRGPLGAGKTAFARGFIGRWLELSGEAPPEHVPSPTYNIAKVYGVAKPVAHLDLYRVKTMQELEHLGFEHYFFESPCCLVEWLEQVPGAAELMRGHDPIIVDFGFGAGTQERTISVSEQGEV